MLYPSAEIRWFFSGPPERGLVAWFNQSYTSVGVGERTDHYLLGVGDALNIKLREGRLEVKQRQWVRAGFQVNVRAQGQMEGWNKWSFGLTGEEEAVGLAKRHADQWLAVHKHRRLRTFIAERAEITETAPGSHPAAGCNAELTVVTAGDRRWHSLGFEAFGAGDRPGLLHSVSEFLLNGDLPLTLPAEASSGYPAWIERNFVN